MLLFCGFWHQLEVQHHYIVSALWASTTSGYLKCLPFTWSAELCIKCTKHRISVGWLVVSRHGLLGCALLGHHVWWKVEHLTTCTLPREKFCVASLHFIIWYSSYSIVMTTRGLWHNKHLCSRSPFHPYPTVWYQLFSKKSSMCQHLWAWCYLPALGATNLMHFG